MTTPAFVRNYNQVIQVAQYSLNNDLHMPALILIYTLIDSIAWAAAPDKEQQVRVRFEEWLNKYVLLQGKLLCTATELYAARCGVLHTLTSSAKLTIKGGVRQITYSWGAANPKAIDRAIELIERKDIVGIHINDLLEAVTEGIAQTVESAESDLDLKARLEAAASLHFTEMKKETLECLMREPHT
jgi:cytosine/adenosine deaminase-related metal-dependent hydrolase